MHGGSDGPAQGRQRENSVPKSVVIRAPHRDGSARQPGPGTAEIRPPRPTSKASGTGGSDIFA